jgi:hypothetical protein
MALFTAAGEEQSSDANVDGSADFELVEVNRRSGTR